MECWDKEECVCTPQGGTIYNALDTIKLGSLEQIKKITRKCKNINAVVHTTSQTILHIVCAQRKLEVLQFLLTFPDLHFNPRDENGYTPLLWAAAAGWCDGVRLLLNARLKCSVNLRAKDGTGANAFRLAYTVGCWDTARLLLKHLCRYADLESDLALIALSGHPESFPNSLGKVGQKVLNGTLLIASEKQWKVVEYLIQRHRFDDHIMTEALLEAAGSCWKAGVHVVKVLIQKHAFDEESLTRAKSVAEACHHDDVVHLLEIAAAQNVLSLPNNEPPEFFPCRCPEPKEKYRESVFTRINLTNTNITLSEIKQKYFNLQLHNHTLLDLACSSQNATLLRELLEYHHIHLNCRDEKGNTPFLLAVEAGFCEGVLMLTQASTQCGLNVSVPDHTGKRNAFLIAHERKAREIMSLILRTCDRDAVLDQDLIQVLTQTNASELQSHLRCHTYASSALVGGLFSAILLFLGDAAVEILHSHSFDTKRLCIASSLAAMSSQWDVVKEVVDVLQNSQKLKECQDNYASLHLDLTLWEAVRCGEESVVRLLSDFLRVDPRSQIPGHSTTSHQEAHTRGHTDMVATFNKNAPPDKLTAEQQEIVNAMQLNRERVKQLFKGAWEGSMGRVQEALTASSTFSISLQASVRDAGGIALPHVMVAGRPVGIDEPIWSDWEIVKDLTHEFNIYMDTIDCRGRNALHLVAQGGFSNRTYQDDLSSQWTHPPTQTDPWLERVRQAVELGVDPRVRDHLGQLPQEIAFHKELASVLQKECEELGPLERPDESVQSERFAEMLMAASTGDIMKAKALLQKRVPLEPRDGYSGPLHVALTRGQRDVMMLLLAGGAPITATSSDGLTILEAARRTPDLPALFPALIREEYMRGIEEELRRVPKEGKENELLREGLDQLLTDIQLKCTRTSWPEESSLGDNWKMLVAAASLGLPLACYFLVQAGARTDLLPGDKSHPLTAAFEASQRQMLITLCRDLQIMPYLVPSVCEKHLPQGLLDHLLMREEEILGELELKERNRATSVQEFLAYISDLKNKKNIPHPSHSAMRLIGELGMVHTLHAICTHVQVDLEMELESASKSRLIHIAALRGHKPLVEYLVRCNVETDVPANGGLMPVHLAALMGHTTCLSYLRHFPGEAALSRVGLTPIEIVEAHDSYVKSAHLDLVTESEEDTILNESRPAVCTRVLLRGKCVNLGIKSPASLRDCALSKKVDFSDPANCRIRDTIKYEMQRLCKAIGDVDSRYQGHIESVGSVAEDVRLLLPDEMDFNIHLDSYHGFEGGNVKATVTEKQKSRNILHQEDDDLQISVQCKDDTDLFKGRNFLTFFEKAVSRALGSFSFESPYLSLIYPGIEMTKVGLALFVAWMEKDIPRVFMPSIDLVPAIPMPWPEGNRFSLLPPHLQKIANNIPVNLTCCGDNQWRYSLSEVEARILSSITNEQRVVILTCKLLCSLLKADWWYPKKYRIHYVVWDHVYLKLNVPVSYIIKTLFIKELAAETQAEPWSGEKYIQRVLSIFRGMVLTTDDGEVIRADKVPSFLLPKYESQRFGDGAQNIIKFLEDLEEGKICREELAPVKQTLLPVGGYSSEPENDSDTELEAAEVSFDFSKYENVDDFEKLELHNSEDEDFDVFD